MKTDIKKLLTLTFLFFTTLLNAKTTPISSDIVANPYINTKGKKDIKLKPINLIKPASLSSDEIDYRKLFLLFTRLTL